MSRKTQKKLRKLLTLVSCAVLLVCVTIGATVAYLTSTATVTNTFTVGNVAITLDEVKVDPNGQAVESAERTSAEQTYHVFPNGTYDKDPTVHVAAGSEEAFIRMKVTVSDMASLKAAFPAQKYQDFYSGDLFLLEKLVTGWLPETWVSTSYTESQNASTNKTEGTYEFRYCTTVKGGTTVTDLDPLFTQVNIPETVDNVELAMLNNIKIIVTAEAIQADGFNGDADAAWEAFDNK